MASGSYKSPVFKPKGFRTQSIPAGKPLKLTIPKPPKMGAMRLPTMKTGGSSMAKAAVAPVRGFAHSAMPGPGSRSIAKAASSMSSTASAPSTFAGWRNQGRIRRPQQDSPFGFLNQ